MSQPFYNWTSMKHIFHLSRKRYRVRRCHPIMNRIFINILIIGTLTGCQWDHQDKLNQVVIESQPNSFQALEVTSPSASLSMTVRHMVTNNDVFVECYVPEFEFTKKGKSLQNKKGYLKISVDHQKPFPIYKAAFVLKNLSKGNHHIRIELVNTDGSTIEGMEKQIFVNVT